MYLTMLNCKLTVDQQKNNIKMLYDATPLTTGYDSHTAMIWSTSHLHSLRLMRIKGRVGNRTKTAPSELLRIISMQNMNPLILPERESC